MLYKIRQELANSGHLFCNFWFSNRSAGLIVVARRCSGCTFTPQGVKNFFSGLIYRKNM